MLDIMVILLANVNRMNCVARGSGTAPRNISPPCYERDAIALCSAVDFSPTWDQITFGEWACDFARQELSRVAETIDSVGGFSNTGAKKFIFAARSDL